MQQTRVEKKGEVRSPDRNKARQERHERETLVIATYFGMLVLMGITIVFVVWRAPNFTPGANNPEAWLKMHQGMNYFIKAKALVKPLIHEPIEKWSRQYQDPDSNCVEVGNGVWLAVGTVDTRVKGSSLVHRAWIVYFVGQTLTPLYDRVGDEESGNLPQALQLAREIPSPDKKER